MRHSSVYTPTVDLPMDREIDGKYEVIKIVSDKIEEVTIVAEADLTQMAIDIQEILDFTDITIVGIPSGQAPLWDADTKTLYIPKGDKGDKGISGTDGMDGSEGAKGSKGDTGVGVDHLKATSTTDPEGDFNTPGRVDTYTFYGDADETINLGHFSIANGVTGVIEFTAELYDKLNALDDSATLDSRLALKEDKALKGEADGYAPLDSAGLVPSTFLPSYVDDVLEFPTFNAFPAIGSSGKIYIAIDTRYSYRWTGSVYLGLSGRVDSVNGYTDVVVLTKEDLALGNVDNTSDADKPISSAVSTSLNGKVGNSRVLTDVPVGAVFTDTVPITSVSSKTGDVILDKTDVGLGNVDNTSDADKPISLTTGIALDLKADKSAFNELDTSLISLAESMLPNSGYPYATKGEDNFVFKEDASFLCKLVDKNRYVKFRDKVVDTYGNELVVNGNFSDGLTGWSQQAGTNSTNEGLLELINSTAYARVVQDIDCIIGKEHVVNVFYKSGTAKDPVVQIRTSTDTAYKTFIPSEGLNTFWFVATNTTHKVVLRTQDSNIGRNMYFDNVSVKKIQTADFTNTAPKVSEIITDGSNTTSAAIAKGEYVLDGSENFNTITLVNGTPTYNNGTLTMVNSDRVSESMNVTKGSPIKFTIKPESIIGGNARYLIWLGDGSNLNNKLDDGWESSTDKKTIIYTPDFDGTLYVTVICDATNATFSEITFKYLADIFQATRDTADMYDYELASGNNVDIVANETMFKADGTVSDSTNGHYYLWIGTTQYAVTIASSWSVNTSSSWQDLGTASNMSLDNPYFQDRTQIGVTHKAIAYHVYSTLTNAYEGIKTEILFTGMAASSTTREIMLANGFSEVSKFLYGKDSNLCLPVEIRQC